MEDILKGLQISLKGIADLRDKMLKELTPEQRIKYSKFETNYAELRRDGDLIGAQKLEEKFKEDMK